jgi:acetyl esterase/lipase
MMLFVRDIPYRHLPNEKLYFDLYQPDEEANVPLIAFFHGGSYTHGSRKDVDMRLLTTLVDNGYAVASVEYRLAPKANIAMILDDCRYAIRWMIANLDGCGLDLGRVAAWGVSAGGRLAALLGTMGEVDAVCMMYGSSNFAEFVNYGGKYPKKADEMALTMFGEKHPPQDLIDQFDPITYINKQSAAFLIVHGQNDKLIPIEQSERLHKALQAKRRDSQFLVLEDAGHEVPDVYLPAVSTAMLSFFRKHLG